MKRNLFRLANEKFDVLILGGGVHGAAIARKLSGAGFNCALIEQNDFSGATSANSLKILHGGLRYLQNLDFRRMRKSVVSRSEIMRSAPDLVRPLRCVMPVYSNGYLKNQYVFKAALYVNDLVGFDRNEGLETPLRLPPGRVLSRKKSARILPGVNHRGLTGGLLWHDAIVCNTERLVLNLLLEANLHSACLANYVKATAFIRNGDRILGVRAKDRLTGEMLEIEAGVVVNATGPWFRRNLAGCGLGQGAGGQKWLLGLNLVINKPFFGDCAVGLEGNGAQGKRLFFFVPWHGHTMVGTYYRPYQGDPDLFTVEKQDIEAFIRELNCVYPSGGITFGDVTFFHGGLLPASGDSQQGGIDLEKREMVIDHQDLEGVQGLLSVRSVKYTTAATTASDVLRMVMRKAEKKPEWHDLRFQGPLSAMYKRTFAKALTAPVFSHLAVEHFVHNEMAAKLSDIVFRRTGVGTAGCPPIQYLNNMADAMAETMGWNMGRKEREIVDVLNRYGPLKI